MRDGQHTRDGLQRRNRVIDRRRAGQSGFAGDAFYNNEPFWSRLHEMDLVAEMTRAGFARENLIHGEVYGVVDTELFPDAAQDSTEDYGRKAAWHVIGARA